MFGVEAKVDLTTSSLPDEIISLLNTEDDLKDITNTGFRDNEEGMEINNINIPIDSDEITCIVCQKPASNAHSCSNCTSTVRVICGKANGEEGYGTTVTVLCFLCTNEQEIQTERTNATMCTEKQAERMINRSNKVLEEADIGCNVLIPIPHVDRGKGDTKNIMAIVHQKTEKGYRLATKHGILLGSYTRTQFEVADSLFWYLQMCVLKILFP
ncbi:SCAN domain-containing protein 3-like [Mytilus edulis]|uniref:SCAN domain-containing protein 3-like n=1 Tax=Mytilus edulis TaxID=6550 RepID=UPI0039EE8AA5